MEPRPYRRKAVGSVCSSRRIKCHDLSTICCTNYQRIL